jgi:hypothetical protein
MAMLEPNNRRLLREALRPPAGYTLDRTITTTFSLDLMALLAIPVSFTFFQMKDHDGPPQVDPLALLEALRRYAGQITVFCQAGQIHVPKHVQLLMGYLETSVHEVLAPHSPHGVFHPKLTVLRYTATQDSSPEEPPPPVVYRVLCSSRNLTFDRSWDTLLILDGVLATHRTNAFARNRPLAQFVRELPGMTIHPMTNQSIASVNSMAEELLKVDFETPEGFSDMEFCPLGFEWTAKWPILKHRRTLAMAPFLDDGFIKRFEREEVPLGVISRIDSLNELSLENLHGLFDAWYMNTAADSIPIDSGEDVTAAEQVDGSNDVPNPDRIELTPASQLHGLHAKLFVSDDGWDGHVWTGSANATKPAFERNVEFMVHLIGKKSKCGIEAFVPASNIENDGDPEGDASDINDSERGFAELLVKYQRNEPPVIDGTRKALERMLDDARCAIISAKIVAHVGPSAEPVQPDGSKARFSVTLKQTSTTPVDLADGVTVQCYPITLKGSAALPMPNLMAADLVVFDPLSFEALTSFFAFRLVATKDDVDLACGFVANLPLIGAPADRQGRILLALLRNREQLLKYLLMLLADDEEAARRLIEAFNADGQNQHANGHEGGFGLPLLEPLLQALDRQPARLDQISRLIDDLRKSPEGLQLVSEEFLSVWEPIWAARKGIGNE